MNKKADHFAAKDCIKIQDGFGQNQNFANTNQLKISLGNQINKNHKSTPYDISSEKHVLVLKEKKIRIECSRRMTRPQKPFSPTFPISDALQPAECVG